LDRTLKGLVRRIIWIEISSFIAFGERTTFLFLFLVQKTTAKEKI